MKFTDDRNAARVFRKFDECSAFKQTLADSDRIFARMQYLDAKVGDCAGYIIARTRCLATGRDDYVAS